MKRKLVSLVLVLVLCLGIAIPSMAASVPAWQTNLNIPHHFATNAVEWTDGTTTDYLYIHTDYDGTAKVSLKKNLKHGELGALGALYVYFDEDGILQSKDDVEVKNDIMMDTETKICQKGGTYYLEPGLYLIGADDGEDEVLIKVYDVNTFGSNPFKDVNINDYFYAPVLWAADLEITKGTTATTFSPNDTCTQAQIITFLWRAVGEPEYTIEKSLTHSAVKEDQYYYDALMWAYENGIITDANIDPNAPCKRSDVALYLWRLAEAPDMGPSKFTDVPASAEYADAVAWAVEWNVTTGTSETTFSPDATCTRGQIVTFLCRATF